MVTPIELASLIEAGSPPASAAPILVGITGSVAAGKSTLAAQVANALAPRHSVAVLSTDGFLRPNADLDAAGLTLRKGFPESYDASALASALKALRRGPVSVPAYSHISYDIDPAQKLTIGPAGVILVEGLALTPENAPLLDHLIYIDAAEADLETWFAARFMAYWHAAAADPASFYARFRSLDAANADVFARSVWTSINLPNLRDHIIRARAAATVVLEKSADHSLRLVRPKPAPSSAQ